MEEKKGMSYADSGVDIDAGNEAVKRILPHARRTFRPEVLSDIGGFGGLFAVPGGYKEPVLVSGTDGVGTKLKVAFMMDKHDTVGQDVVAYCVNDVIVQGAEILFFLDYIGVGKLLPEKVEAIVKGVADGCQLAGCALLGGETAELPGFYSEGEYDLVGFAVGVVEKDQIIDGSTIAAGDVIIGLASSGLHSSGYSLARKAIFTGGGYDVHDYVAELGRTIGEEMLIPTRIYVRSLLALQKAVRVKGLSNITGGGFYDNIPRVLPDGVRAVIEKGTWPIQPIFPLIQKCGAVADYEMYRTFNMGIGMIAVVAPEDVESAMTVLREQGEEPYRIGTIVAGEKGVDLV
jgi:phosphoribosylformylglycinamidine cyclo-ligase